MGAKRGIDLNLLGLPANVERRRSLPTTPRNMATRRSTAWREHLGYPWGGGGGRRAEREKTVGVFASACINGCIASGEGENMPTTPKERRNFFQEAGIADGPGAGGQPGGKHLRPRDNAERQPWDAWTSKYRSSGFAKIMKEIYQGGRGDRRRTEPAGGVIGSMGSGDAWGWRTCWGGGFICPIGGSWCPGAGQGEGRFGPEASEVCGVEGRGSTLPAKVRSEDRVRGPHSFHEPSWLVVLLAADSGQVDEDDGGGDAPVAVGDRR